MRTWRVALAALVMICATSTVVAQTTLYSDDFSGAGGALNGTTPDVTIGTNTWSANNAFNNNGTIVGTNEGSALLPFDPVVNAMYTLSMDVVNTSAQWIALGFARDPLLTAGGSNANDRLAGEPEGIAWMLYRNSATANQDVQIFDGLRTAGNHFSGDPVTDFSVAHNLKIVIDTTGDGTSFTANFLIDNVSLLAGGTPRTIARTIGDINFAALSFDNTAATPPTFDNFLLTGISTINEWNVNGGGSLGVAGNWTMGAPTAGSSVQFGSIVTADNSPATVTLDAPATLGQIFFSNSNASYILAGPSTLTLNGLARVTSASGTHTIDAQIAGSTGLTKAGGGVLVLSNTNSYTGDTTITGGTLAITTLGALNQASGTTNIGTGAVLQLRGDSLGGGASGTLTEAIAGAGQLRLDTTLTTETITLASANTGFTGTISVGGGKLVVSNAGALGSADGLAATGTAVGGGLETGTLELNNVAITGERLELTGRQPANIDPHVISNGTSSWSGPIVGNTGGNFYNIESQSGTLTLSGNITMPDTANDTAGRNLTLSGASSGVISGKIIDRTVALNDGAENVNINVIKQGTGTWTIATGTSSRDDFHQGRTAIQQGTLAVLSPNGNDGELYSRTIEISSGATFDVSSFTSYSLQAVENPDNAFSTGDEVGQNLTGSGNVTGSIEAFDDSSITPGSSGIGNLSVSGNFSYSTFTPLATGRLNYELGNTTTAGDSDRLVVGGSATMNASSGGLIKVNVAPVEGTLAAGAYTLVQAGSVGGTATSGDYTVTVLDSNGADITAGVRQTFAVANSGNNVNLNVTGSSANLSWAGTSGNEWDVNTTANFTGAGGPQFRQLDNVTFGNVANKNVSVNTNVAPGAVTFNGGVGSTYTVTGTGGITGYGPVTVSSGTVKLNNTGNNYSGATTVASGARLEMATASLASTTVNGTLAVSGNVASTLIDNFNDGNNSEYNTYTVLDQIGTLTSVGPPDDVVYSNTGSAMTVNGAQNGNPAPEQALALRATSLAVGETLVVDTNLNTNHSTFATVGIAIADGAVQTDIPAGVANADVRKSYLITGMRLGEATDGQNTTSVQSTGTASVSSTGPGNVGVVTNLWITRTGTGTYTMGHSKDNMATRVQTDSRTGMDWNPDSVGFYADIRGALTPNAGAMDNLRIAPIGNNVLSIEGSLTLASTGTLELDLGQDAIDRINVTGTASLDGNIMVSLASGLTPVDGQQFTILSALGGITDLGINYLLPTNFSAAIVNTTDLVLTYTVPVGLPGDFNNDGTVDAADYTVYRDNLGALDETALNGNGDNMNGVDVGDYNLWRANFGAVAGPGALGGAGSVPEPSTLLLLVGLAAGCLRTLRRG